MGVNKIRKFVDGENITAHESKSKCVRKTKQRDKQESMEEVVEPMEDIVELGI